jgi:hypothetical protein
VFVNYIIAEPCFGVSMLIVDNAPSDFDRVSQAFCALEDAMAQAQRALHVERTRQTVRRLPVSAKPRDGTGEPGERIMR